MSEIIAIEGGHKLNGTVEISGAKNATVALIPAIILADSPVTIYGVPEISDVDALAVLLEELNCTVLRSHDSLIVDPSRMENVPLVSDAVDKLRASYYLMGALLGKCKKVVMKAPGGCFLGPRPIDLHIKGFEALGAKVEFVDGAHVITADRLVGAKIYLDFASVGATINILLAAVKAEGKTVIENAAKEPHIVDVANFLNSMGADIRGAGTDVIRIKGVEKFHDTEYSVIPDQIEAGTFMMAAAATRGDVLIKNVIPKHLETISAKLSEIGAQIEESDDAVRVVATQRLCNTQIKTLPYPGFPTDMQPQMAITLGLSTGTSTITESIFENRFRYVEELRRMGANIKMVEGNTAIIHGVEKYTGATVAAPDLRAGAALVIAGLAAEGYTTVTQIGYIQRGYERFDEKLRALGGLIEKVDSEKETNKFIYKTGTVN